MSVFSPLRTELGRSFTKIFGAKGGFQPRPGEQLVSTIGFDGSFEPLPWPAARRFGLSSQIAGLAANNSGVVIRNEDPLDSGSLIIIDALDALAGVASYDLLFTMHALGSNVPLSGPFSPIDVNSPPGAVVSNISNVKYAGFQGTPAATTGYRYFGVVGTPTHFVLNPYFPRWTIGPQLELAIWCGTVNTQISFTIGGRYYASAA